MPTLVSLHTFDLLGITEASCSSARQYTRSANGLGSVACVLSGAPVGHNCNPAAERHVYGYQDQRCSVEKDCTQSLHGNASRHHGRVERSQAQSDCCACSAGYGPWHGLLHAGSSIRATGLFQVHWYYSAGLSWGANAAPHFRLVECVTLIAVQALILCELAVHLVCCLVSSANSHNSAVTTACLVLIVLVHLQCRAAWCIACSVSGSWLAPGSVHPAAW
jgi:hypothetical protein